MQTIYHFHVDRKCESLNPSCSLVVVVHPYQSLSTKKIGCIPFFTKLFVFPFLLNKFDSFAKFGLKIGCEREITGV